MKSRILRTVVSFVVLTTLVPLAPLASIAAPTMEPVAIPEEDPPPPVQASELMADGNVFVRVIAPGETDLSKYGHFVMRHLPAIEEEGMMVYYGAVTEEMLLSLRADRRVTDVARIQMQAEAPDARSDPDLDRPDGINLEAARARLVDLRDNPPEPVQRPEPTGWWDVSSAGHNAYEAWDNGYTGAGMAVAVNDSGVDMVHPDFWGTEHRYQNVSGDPYYDYFDGWPVALSPISNYLMAYDLEINGQLTDLNTFAYGITNFGDTSFTGTGSTILFDGTVYTTTGTAHAFNTEYHIGYHPDWSLYGYVWGEPIAVLVVDEDGDETYETVYVDLDNDYDFRDEDPVHRDNAPWNNRAQGADELAMWDADLDGYPDVSGGMLYFIADGEHCPPFFDVYFGCSTSPWGGSFDPPDNGDLVAFMFTNLYDTDHGQLCASNVVGQGNIDGVNGFDGSYPDWKTDGMGGMVQGAGRDAELVPVGDIYWGFEQSVEQAWWFQALGYDGEVTNPADPWDDDSLQASSNSFGPWNIYEDGWSEWGRIPTLINYYVNPFTTYFMSSGNTGPGFGTTGAPQPITAIQTGSSSQYGSTGFVEPIASLDQILVGEAASYYSRGPSANNQLVPHVTADGSWASGAVGVNETLDSWTAWDIWGGTSRSGPVAMGVATLVMDAYYQRHGILPQWYEIQQLMMQGANHIYNSPMDGGTGYINAGRSASIAGGNYGISATLGVSPFPYWDVGDFDGDRYIGGFAHIAEPDGVYTTPLIIENTGWETATVTVSDYVLEATDIYTFSFDTAWYTEEDGEFLKPDYLFALDDIIGGSIPSDTVYIMAELMHPFDTFDYNGDEATDNYFRLNGYEWTDLDGDGILWDDVNSNNLVEWGEIDELEYIRFNRAYDENHYQYLPISDPLNLYENVFLGIRHRLDSANVPTTTLTLQVVLYRQADWAALDTDDFFGGTADIPPGMVYGDMITFTAPTEFGLYQGAVQIDVETGEWVWNDEMGYDVWEDVEYTTIVPVFTQVAYQGDLTSEPEAIRFGDNADPYEIYSNGYVRPIKDWWQGRATGGDWRFFFLNQTDPASAPGWQSRLVARTTWESDAPPADIDTFLLGPNFSFSSIANDPLTIVGSSYATPDSDLWGPYSLWITGRSESALLSGGHWAFDTATGTNVDYAVGEFNSGLNSIQLHSHRHSGTEFREDFAVEVGYISAPEFLEWDNYSTERLTITTNLTFTEDVTVTAYGLSPVSIVDEPNQTVVGASTFAYNACVATYHYTFTASNLAQLSVVIDNFVDGDDLDLFVLYDYDDSGTFDCASEVIGDSGSGDPDPEFVDIDFPPDGLYQVAVDPYAVGSDDSDGFDLFVDGLEYGDTIQVTNLDVGSFGPGDQIAFDVFNKGDTCDDDDRICLGGFVQVWLEGDGLVPLLEIPVNPRYNELDLSQSSFKVVTDYGGYAVPNDVLTYTIMVVNTSTSSGTAVITDFMPSGVTFITATTDFGYSYDSVSNTVTWDNVFMSSGGGEIVSSDYDWIDISGEMETTGPWYSIWRGDDDEGIMPVTLPFTYTFFGQTYTETFVSANGQVQFDSVVSPTAMGDGLLPGDDFFMDWYWGPYATNDNRIAVLFGDQTGPDGLFDYWGVGEYPQRPRVFTYHDDNGTAGFPDDDSFIIQWDEWSLSPMPCRSLQAIGCEVPYPDNTYQLILYADGRAKAQYAEINVIPPTEAVYYGGGVWDYWNTSPQAGVEGPADWTGLGVGEGYAWHLTPESGTAWEYVPSPSESTVLTITAQVNDPITDTLLCNDAFLDNGLGQITWLDDCTEIAQADLDVSKTVDRSEVVTGEWVTFTVIIENTGPLSTTVVMYDILDEGFSLPSEVVTASLDVDDVLTVTYSTEVTTTVPNNYICNDLEVDNGFGTFYYDQACVLANPAGLDVDKYSWWTDLYLWPGTVITYEVEVHNSGTLTTSAWITDFLPSEVIFGAVVYPPESGYLSSTHVITAYFDELAPGVFDYLVVTGTVQAGLPNGTLLYNVAEVEDGLGIIVSDDDTVWVNNADFRDSWKDVSAEEVMPGEVFTYYIGVVNAGPLTASIVVTDVIPYGVEVITPDLPMGATYDPGTRVVNWTGDVGAAVPDKLVDIAPGFVDISGSGTPVTWPGSDDDEGVASLGLPWLFPFWEAHYITVEVSANGVVGFGGLNAPWNTDSGGYIPDPSAPNNAIFGYYADQCGPIQWSCPGTVYYQDMGDGRFIVQYDGWGDLVFGFPNTYQIILYQGGAIEVQYDAIYSPVPFVAYGSGSYGYVTDQGVEIVNGGHGLIWQSGPPISYTAWGFYYGFATEMVLPIPVEVQWGPSMGIINEATIEGAGDSWTTNEVWNQIRSVDHFDLYKDILVRYPWDEHRGDDMSVNWGQVFTYGLTVHNHVPISTPVFIYDELPDGIEVITDRLPMGMTYSSTLHDLTWSGTISEAVPEHLDGPWDSFFDISGYTETLTWGDDDEGVESIPIPWDWGWDLMGWQTHEVWVSANGLVGAVEGTEALRDGDGAIGSDNDPNGAIFALYGDQQAGGSGTVYWYHDEQGTPWDQGDDRLYIQFDNWRDVTSGSTNTYQVVLYSDNSAEVYYDTINSIPLISATVPYSADVGVEDPWGNWGLTWESVPASGTGWHYEPHRPGELYFEVPAVATLEAAQADKALFNSFHLIDDFDGRHESNTTRLSVESTEIEVVKLANSATVDPGGVITYTVILRNVGDLGVGWWGSSTWAATMLDDLPAGVTYIPGTLQVVRPPFTGWTPDVCGPVGGDIVCTFDVMPWWPSSEVWFRYAVDVDETGWSEGDMITNTVAVNDSFDVMSYGSVVVDVTPAVAKAGPDQSVDTLEMVYMDGSASYDLDLPLTYMWQQTGGTATVTLSDASVVSPTFTAPDDPDVLVFSLIVTDSVGTVSTPDTVTVVVNNQEPVADAGADHMVKTNDIVTLDGSGSNDVDNDVPLIYDWTQVGGPAVTLSSYSVESPTFTATALPTFYVFTLAVTDTFGLADPTIDVVVITTEYYSLFLPVIVVD